MSVTSPPVFTGPPRPPTMPPPGDRDAQISFFLLAAVPIALGIAFVLGYALGFDPENEKGVGPTLEGAEWLRLAALWAVAVLPAALGTFFGARATRRGGRNGRVALAINGVVLVGLTWLTAGTTIVGSVTFTPDKVAAVSVSVGAPVSGQTYVGVAGSKFGTILVDRAGNTLYTDEFTAQAWKGRLVDARGGEDRKNWIPYVATAAVTVDAAIDPAHVGAVLRADGDRQLTYYGRGLYTFRGDVPGQFKAFDVQLSKAAGGGPRWADRHVVTPNGALLP